MIDLTTSIVPYKGTGIFQLYSKYDEVKNLLEVNHIPYEEDIWNRTAPRHLWNVLVSKKTWK